MYRVTFQGLETLCCIARMGTFDAAAKHLCTTQPAISARVRELESALGVSLFARQGRRMVLTMQGRELVQQLEPLLLRMDDVLLSLENAGAASGTVRLGVGEAVAMDWLPPMIAQLKKQMPKVSYQIEVDLTVRLRQRLESGELDLAILAAPVVLHRVESASVGLLRLAWTISPQLRRQVPPPARARARELLEAYPVWSISRPSTIYPITVSSLKEFEAGVPGIDTCEHMMCMKELVASGAGIALLPQVLIQQDIAAGRLELLSPRLPQPRLEFAIAWNTDREQTIIRRIVEIARTSSSYALDGKAGRKAVALRA